MRILVCGMVKCKYLQEVDFLGEGDKEGRRKAAPTSSLRIPFLAWGASMKGDVYPLRSTCSASPDNERTFQMRVRAVWHHNMHSITLQAPTNNAPHLSELTGRM
jgi:hypothetical protein